MFATLAAILPIFALIGAGFVGRRLSIFGPAAQVELTRFVVKLALPALLFAIIAEAKPAELWQPGFVFAFGAGCLITAVLTVLVRRRSVPMPDAIIDGLIAGYANTGFIGIPLCLVLLGPRSLVASSIASILTICILFAVAIFAVDVALQPRARLGPLVAKAAIAAGRNPLVFAPFLGALMLLSGVALPAPAARFVDLLGAAASPCALVALGLFVGEKRPKIAAGGVVTLVAAKLILQPGLTWLFAYVLWPQPAFLAKAAVLIAALPTGTGPFMLAEMNGREADLAARVILVSTVLSIVTIALIMVVL